jgi:hypothetical protein
MEDVKRCPRCHSDEVIPVAYGLPSSEMVEESLAGRVALGGRVAWPEAPDWRCVRCGHEGRKAALEEVP